MNVVKRRWPDLLIGLLVLLLVVGFAALLLGQGGRGTTGTPAQTTPQAGTPAQTSPEQTTPEQTTPAQTSPGQTTPDTSTPAATVPATPQTGTDESAPVPTPATGSGTQAGTTDANGIPTIPAAPVTDPNAAPTPGTTTPATDASTPAATPTDTAPADAATVTPRTGGAVPASEARTPTRNDYRISLGSYASTAAVQAATAGVGKLGYTVYPIDVASGVVAQVGPFATREEAAQALADIQRALPGALLYPPRNAPASDTSSRTGTGSTATGNTSTGNTGAGSTGTSASSTAGSAAQATPSGPVYLQVGAYNSTTAAQTAVSRVRDLGLEPSVNAPTGKLVTVVVGPFQGQALENAEAKLKAGGIDSFRVR